MMDMLTLNMIIALFIVIPFAVPFIIIGIVRHSDKNNSSGRTQYIGRIPNSGPPPIYTRPYPPTPPQRHTAAPFAASEKKTKSAKHDMTVSNVLFLIGTIFVVLSGIAFGVASWVHTSHTGRVAIIIAAAAVSFILSIIISRFLRLSGTAVSFYVLGTGFLSTALLTAGYYSLMGSWLSFTGDGLFALLAASSALAAIMLFAGVKLYRSLPLMYAALSVSALSLFFTAFQIGDTFEGAVPALIMLQAVITAALYLFRAADKKKYETPLKIVGTVAATIYGTLASVYVLYALPDPTVQAYSAISVILFQLLFYGHYKKTESLIYAESIVSLLLALMAAMSIYSLSGKRSGCLLFFAASFVLYLLHRYVPSLKHILTESVTLVTAAAASAACLCIASSQAFVPETASAILMSAVIGAYIFSKRKAVRMTAGISAVVLPMITCGFSTQVISDLLSTPIGETNLVCWCILALILVVSAFILDRLSSKADGKWYSQDLFAAVYTDLAAAGLILMVVSCMHCFYAVPMAVCLLHFAVSNRLRVNVTAVLPALTAIILMYEAITDYPCDDFIKCLTMFCILCFYMAVSRLVYGKGIIIRTEKKLIVDPMLLSGWLAIGLMLGTSRDAVFFTLMSAAVYCGCFVKKNTSAKTAAMLLTFTTFLAATAIMTRPFLIPDSKQIVSKINIATLALTGLSCRLVWRKFREAAKYSSNAIYIMSFVALLLDAVIFDNGTNTIFVMTVMIFVLIASIMQRSKTWFIASSVCLFTVTVFATREYLMALRWWIYLFFAGMVLIALAAVNEYCKKNNETLRTSIAKRFSGWTW